MLAESSRQEIGQSCFHVSPFSFSYNLHLFFLTFCPNRHHLKMTREENNMKHNGNKGFHLAAVVGPYETRVCGNCPVLLER